MRTRGMGGIAFAALVAASIGHAASIEERDVLTPGDGAGTWIEGTGLLWLDLRFTKGMSLAAVEADPTLGGQFSGFRVATLAEVDELFTRFGFSPDSGCANGAGHCSLTGENLAAANSIISFLGEPGDNEVIAMFRNPNIPAGSVGRAFADNGTIQPFGSVDARTDFTEPETYSDPDEGVFLVAAASLERIASVDLFASGDGALTLVGPSGLYWLDLPLTFGKTVPEVEADPTLGGLLAGLQNNFRVATLSEVDQMFTDFGFTPDAGCDNGAMHCSPEGESLAAANEIVSKFDNPQAISIVGLFRNPNLNFQFVGRAFADPGGNVPTGSVDATTEFFEPSTYSDPIEGVFLVTSSAQLNPNVWLWTGVGSFSDSGNWRFGPPVGGPVARTDLGVHFGPLTGVPSGVNGPSSQLALLSEDYTSTSTLAMVNGIPTELTIQNATYELTTANVGLPAPAGSPAGTAATLNLETGQVSGPLVVGAGGNGIMNVTGPSVVSGGALTLANGNASTAQLNILASAQLTVDSLQLDRGTVDVVNSGLFTLPNSVSAPSNGTDYSWTNSGSGVLQLSGSSGLLRGSPTIPAALVNDSGAVIRRLAGGNSTISWPTTNEGLISVEDGARLLISSYSGLTGTVETSTDGLIDIDSFSEPTTLAVSSGRVTFDQRPESSPLRLEGTVAIEDPLTGASIDVFSSVDNAAQVTLNKTVFASNQSTATEIIWRNLAGSSLLIGPGAFFRVVTNSPPRQLINDAGSALEIPASRSFALTWDLLNNGNVIVGDEGRFSISTYAGTGTFDLNATGLIDIDSFSEPTTLAVSSGRVTFDQRPESSPLRLEGTVAIDDPALNNAQIAVFSSVDNAAQVTLNETVFASNSSNATEILWRNLAGSSLLIGPSASFTFTTGSPPRQLINDAGSALEIPASRSFALTWDLLNNGNVIVGDEGRFSISTYAGTGTFDLNATGLIDIDSFSEPTTLAVSSGRVTFDQRPESSPLRLEGTVAIEDPLTGASIDVFSSVDNAAQVTLNKTVFASNQSTATEIIWRNLAGSSLLIGPGAFFRVVTNSPPRQLINDAGSALEIPASRSFALTWDLLNNGNVIVGDEGRFSISTYAGTGTFDLNATGLIDIDSFSEPTTLAVSSGRVTFDQRPESSPLRLEGTVAIDDPALNNAQIAVFSSVDNAAQVTLNETVFASNSSNATEILWRNLAGSSLLIGPSASFTFTTGSPPRQLINDAGSALEIPASRSFALTWDLLNNGNVIVGDEGRFSISTYAGTGTFDLNATGLIDIDSFSEPTTLAVSSGRVTFDQRPESSPLRLEGTVAIEDPLTGASIDVFSSVDNAAQVTLNETVFASNSSNATEILWRNLAGSSLLIGPGASFTFTTNSPPRQLINDAGALITSAGGTTVSITWDLINNGTISPGSSAGSLSLGPTTLGDSSVLVMEILGTATNEFDRIFVSGGDLILGGRLTVIVEPSVGAQLLPTDDFAIIDAVSPVIGAFKNALPNERILGSSGSTFRVIFGASSPDPSRIVLTDYQAVSDSLSDSVTNVSGTAEGGTVSITLNGTLITITTTSGQTSAQVVAALANAINATFPGQARAIDNILEVTGMQIEAFTTTDPGLSGDLLVDLTKIPIPLYFVLLLLCALAVTGDKIARRRAAGRFS